MPRMNDKRHRDRSQNDERDAKISSFFNVHHAILRRRRQLTSEGGRWQYGVTASFFIIVITEWE